ncbi:MAG: flagellar basal body P-ring formation protein FlgA [Alphaproteobacteria bacterium]|nr:flagellar basal body P-ring formation protein FlgA [Alphaproteobacteria bacterium]
MTSRLSIVSVLAILLQLWAVPAAAAAPVRLHANIVVDDDAIRLRDVFDGAGAHGDKVIAYAPAPGRKLVLEATWLYRVARAYRLPWRPSSRFDRAVVERSSQVIGTDQIAETLLIALKSEAKIQDDLEIELDNRSLQIFLPVGMPEILAVRSISYSPRNGRFSAVLVAPDDSPDALRFSATGSAHRLVQVPTLAQRLYADDIISERDIIWKPMRVNRLDPRTVLNGAKMIGMSPRRPIVAGRAIMTTEVQPPTLVRRGKQVTIQLETPTMRLSALGKSLQNGGKGDIVRVQNLDSGKTIEAVVVGPERVSVSTTGPIALN